MIGVLHCILMVPGNLNNMTKKMRDFGGAKRDLDDEKIDLEGFLSPRVLQRYGEYMHKHRKTADGLRDSDNWQKGSGIPLDVYMKSMWRHFHDVWKSHRGDVEVDMEDSLCALLFNAMGYLHERIRDKDDYHHSLKVTKKSYKFGEEIPYKPQSEV